MSATALAQSASWLPPYALEVAFTLSVLLALLQVGKIIYDFLEGPELDVTLTREVFARLLDEGEVFFLNAVLLARNGNVLITDAAVALTKQSGAPKQYRMRVHWVGEKVQKENSPMADFYFHSTSAREFVPKDQPRRVVYMVIQSEYAPKINSSIRSFVATCAQIRGAVRVEEGADELDEKSLKLQYEKMMGAVRDAAREVSQLLQLEEGAYRLSLEVTYTSLARLRILRRERKTSATITFEIGADVAGYRAALEPMYLNRARELALGEATKYLNPEYAPTKVREL